MEETITIATVYKELKDFRAENEKRWEENDRRDILDILDTMQKTIDNQFSNLKEYMDAKFDKVYAAQMVNDIEHAEFRQLLKAYGIRINLQNSRITYLENWKKECDDGGFVAVN